MDMQALIAAQTADPTLATYCLDRLARLADRLALATDERERLILTRALFALFLDCLDLGLGEPARAIVADHRTTPVFVGNGAAA